MPIEIWPILSSETCPDGNHRIGIHNGGADAAIVELCADFGHRTFDDAIDRRADDRALKFKLCFLDPRARRIEAGLGCRGAGLRREALVGKFRRGGVIEFCLCEKRLGFQHTGFARAAVQFTQDVTGSDMGTFARRPPDDVVPWSPT